MRWLVWYFRSLFCNHDWKHEERQVTETKDLTILENIWVNDDPRAIERFQSSRTRVSATCKKCGWHRSYYKFGN